MDPGLRVIAAQPLWLFLDYHGAVEPLSYRVTLRATPPLK